MHPSFSVCRSTSFVNFNRHPRTKDSMGCDGDDHSAHVTIHRRRSSVNFRGGAVGHDIFARKICMKN